MAKSKKSPVKYKKIPASKTKTVPHPDDVKKMEKKAKAPKPPEEPTKREKIAGQRHITYVASIALRDSLRGFIRDGNMNALLASLNSFIIYYESNNVEKK